MAEKEGAHQQDHVIEEEKQTEIEMGNQQNRGDKMEEKRAENVPAAEAEPLPAAGDVAAEAVPKQEKRDSIHSLPSERRASLHSETPVSGTHVVTGVPIAAPETSEAEDKVPAPSPKQRSASVESVPVEEQHPPILVEIIRANGTKKQVRLNKGERLKLKPGEKLAPNQSDRLKVQTGKGENVKQEAGGQPQRVVVRRRPPMYAYDPYPYYGYPYGGYGYGCYGYPYGYGMYPYGGLGLGLGGGMALGLGMGLML
ncbi:unnamed protein product [Amoebophrya sp. A120]|nr:unnamed protein product [Amoebophrya sp. A120]|eukprot:GSA120T00010413001.1